MTRPICTKKWTVTTLAGLLIGLAALLAAAQTARAKTVQDLYPLLSDRFIKSAKLTALEDDLILKTDTDIVLTRNGMAQALDQHDPGLRGQLENKQQAAVRSHIHDLGQRHPIRINEKWMDVQYKLMTDNPVDKARLSGKPSMVEFGADGCVPCDMMQPILEKLKKKFPGTLNIVFLHVRENQVLAGRYGIQSIPVQAFFDANGQEVFRHTGFFAEEAVTKQLKQMGVAR